MRMGPGRQASTPAAIDFQSCSLARSHAHVYTPTTAKRKVNPMSQPLRDARRYEEEKGRAIPPEQRPLFHLSARAGWMNDPNGFSFHAGEYHLFYQSHP